MKIANAIEQIIEQTVKEELRLGLIPELPTDFKYTDTIAEVIEKLCILHIRTWFLEDMAGLAKTDEELASIKRKIDICFKQKRPAYVQAINKMLDQCIKTEKSLVEDSVKVYKGVNDESTNKIS